MEVSRRLEVTDPEHTYRFFPSHKPWMWEQDPTGQEPSENTGGNEYGQGGK